MRLRSFLTLLLVALWLPAQTPCANALMLLGHDADGTHDASLSWDHGHLHVVFQHAHAVDSDLVRIPGYDVTVGVMPPVHGTEHADHVFHPAAPDQFIRAARGDSSSCRVLQCALADAYGVVAPRDDRVPCNNRTRVRSSPALRNLRSTILLI